MILFRKGAARKTAVFVCLVGLLSLAALAALNSPPFRLVNEGKLQGIGEDLAKFNSHSSFIVVTGKELGLKKDPKKDRLAELIHRASKALELAGRLPKAKLILSGVNAYKRLADPNKIKSWLVKNGVDPERIFIEKGASGAVENAARTARLLRKLDARKVVLVSDHNYASQAAMLFQFSFKEAGMSNIQLRSEPWDGSERSLASESPWAAYRDALRIYLLR